MISIGPTKYCGKLSFLTGDSLVPGFLRIFDSGFPLWFLALCCLILTIVIFKKCGKIKGKLLLIIFLLFFSLFLLFGELINDLFFCDLAW